MEVDTSLGATSPNGGANNGVGDVNVTISRDQNTSPNNSGEGGGKEGREGRRGKRGRRTRMITRKGKGGRIEINIFHQWPSQGKEIKGKGQLRWGLQIEEKSIESLYYPGTYCSVPW